MSLNPKQILGILIVVFSVLAVSTAQLTDIFGPQMAKIITSVAGLANAIMGGIVTLFSTQTSLVKEVAAMPGVERVSVNASANQTLATMAVDPQQDKVAPTTGAIEVVTQTAKGNNT